MPNPTPGAASTTLPPYNFDVHGRLVWVYSALDAAINAEVLDRRWLKERSKSCRHALFAGVTALRVEHRDCIRHAQEEGKLLLCWHGTRSLEVPA